jgi:TonB-dependent starch-binding outer membrane protein SusC
MKKNLLLIFISFLSLGVFAQELMLTGIVTSAEDRQPLPGATVVVKGTTNGTITNFDGMYELNVPSNATLVFSFVGMDPSGNSCKQPF